MNWNCCQKAKEVSLLWCLLEILPKAGVESSSAQLRMPVFGERLQDVTACTSVNPGEKCEVHCKSPFTGAKTEAGMLGTV